MPIQKACLALSPYNPAKILSKESFDDSTEKSDRGTCDVIARQVLGELSDNKPMISRVCLLSIRPTTY
jgi:hypothetical protein